MVTEVDICNAALLKLGDENIISTLGQDGREGESCEILYPQVRDWLLASHPWNFAIGRSLLAADTATPAFEYTKQYYLPSDCLRALKLYDTDERWKVEGDKLLTDESTPRLIYIKAITNTGQFSPLFTETLALFLASALAAVIPGSDNKGQILRARANEILREARRRDGQEGTPDNFEATAFTNFKITQGWW